MDRRRIQISFTTFLCCLLLVFGLSVQSIALNGDHSVDGANYKKQYEETIFEEVTAKPYDGAGDLDGIAISPQGGFLLVHSSGLDHYVDIYSSVGMFHRGYKLTGAGNILATFDEEDTSIVVFYLVRENLFIKAHEDGTFISTSIGNNISEIVNDLSALDGFSETHSGITYEFIGKNPFNKNSQRITLTDTNGVVLYSYAPNIHEAFFNTATVILIVIIGVVWLIVFVRGRGRRLSCRPRAQ